MNKSILEQEKNLISLIEELPSREQQEVVDFVEFLRQKKISKKQNIEKIMSLRGALKDDKGLEKRMKEIRKELNKWRNIESV